MSTMANSYLFLVVLALFGAQCLAMPEYFVDYEDPEEMVSIIKRESPPDKKCIKDILLVWDNSRSVGGNFGDMVKFLKEFVKSPRLDVNPEGTHIALISFSNLKNTKKLLDFDQITKKEQLLTFLDNIKQNDLKGESTMTGRALYEAAKIFRKHDPENHRIDTDDVLIILTDGDPTTKYENVDLYNKFNVTKEKELADHFANILRVNRGIKIIGVAIGPKRKETRHNLEDWSDRTYDAEFDGLTNILNSIVDMSCIGKGCKCPVKEVSISGFLTPGQETMTVDFKSLLPKETDVCHSTPPFKSKYGLGNHTEEYEYGPRTCKVHIEVKECMCPRISKKFAYLKSGEQKIAMEWQEPKPSCDAIIANTAVEPKIKPGHEFKPGFYQVSYKYDYHAGFSLTCRVDIEVKAIPCKGKDYNPETHECCCGILAEKIGGGMCCGSVYFDSNHMKCCSNSNVVGLNYKCPEEMSAR